MAVYAKATYEYQAMDPGDLSFVEGDRIEILSQEGEWWEGRMDNGRKGFFPFNRVKLLPHAQGIPGNDNLRNLNVRLPQEKVGRVAVDLKDTKKGHKKQCYFSVNFDMSSGEQVSVEKTMHDFRRFDNALKILDPNYDFVVTLPPEWADEIPLNQNQGKDKAEKLSKYLAHNTKGREVFDLLLAKWASASKNDLRNGQASDKAQVSSSDSRQSVLTKINQALASAYKKQVTDPTRWFVGASKSGDLVQTTFDWNQRDDTELSLLRGDYVLVSQKKTRYDGWWLGMKVDGTTGLFPSNYVEVLGEIDLKKRFKAAKGTAKGSSPASAPAQYGANNMTPISPITQGITKQRSDIAITPANLGVSGGSARDRKIESGFCVKSVDAYDELKGQGYTIEQRGKYIKAKKGRAAKPGDMVSLDFSAYVWDPQTQQLREFSSSDQLKAPPKGVSSGQAGANGIKMEFVIGSNTAIDGLEEVIQCLDMNSLTRAIIAPMIGYGDVGSPPEIPGNCYLVYDLTLINVQNGGTFAPPRRDQVFSVGISRPNVQQRMPSKRGDWGNNQATSPGKKKKKTRTQNNRPTVY